MFNTNLEQLPKAMPLIKSNVKPKMLLVSKLYHDPLPSYDHLSNSLMSLSAACRTVILCTDPELDEEECVVWPFFIQLLQASFLLRKLVVNLPHIYGLQHGIVVARV